MDVRLNFFGVIPALALQPSDVCSLLHASSDYAIRYTQALIYEALPSSAVCAYFQKVETWRIDQNNALV